MSPAILIHCLRAAFVSLFLTFLIYESLERPRVLVLHSYATDFGWVNDINTGIDRVFDGQGYSVRYFYMDTKRHPFEDFKQAAGRRARRMIDDWRPDVIIAADDNAQRYAAMHYVGRDDVELVFCGINKRSGDDAYGYQGAANVTGVYENLPWRAIIDELQAILPPGSRILHLSDDSPSSVAVHERIEQVDWAPFDFVGSHMVGTRPAWEALVENEGTTADCFLITHYHTLVESAGSSERVEPRDIMQWTAAHSDQPLVGTFPFFVDDGGSLVIGVSAIEQGESAARMCAQIIDNDERAGAIPAVDNEMFVVLLREQDLKRRLGGAVTLPPILRSFAHAIDGYRP